MAPLACSSSTLAQTSSGAPPREPLDTLRQVSATVRGCWRVPEALRSFERLDATIRFSLRSDGSVLGQRVAFADSPPNERLRDLLVRSAQAALDRCAPLSLSPSLGAAIAGRVFVVRLTYRGPKGRGA